MVSYWWFLKCSHSITPFCITILNIIVAIKNPHAFRNMAEGLVPLLGIIIMPIPLVTIWYIATITKNQDKRFRLIQSDEEKERAKGEVLPSFTRKID
ncbi:MAG: hypothetical protein COA78_19315 [Blastopirellula sp.]|nr:MAG: hypothetical protein COA78_19315 [Blastopirellula sp.]